MVKFYSMNFFHELWCHFSCFFFSMQFLFLSFVSFLLLSHYTYMKYIYIHVNIYTALKYIYWRRYSTQDASAKFMYRDKNSRLVDARGGNTIERDHEFVCTSERKKVKERQCEKKNQKILQLGCFYMKFLPRGSARCLRRFMSKKKNKKKYSIASFL